MRTIYFTIVIIILAAIIGILLFDKFSGVEITGDGLILRDTVVKEIYLDPIKIRDTITEYKKKNVYINVEVPDTASQKLAEYYLSQRDSLHALLHSKGVSEIAVLDTVVPPHMDSIVAAYSLYDKIWLVDFRPAPRKFEQIDKTIVLGRDIMKLAKEKKGYRVDWKWIPTTMVITSVIVGSAVHTWGEK